MTEEYDWVAFPKPKRRIWRCECGTALISKPLDADTFDRIPSFTICPICGRGTLIKQEED